MRHQPIEFREERDMGQKINATFGFLRQNLRLLLRCMLYLVVPVALAAGIFSGLYQSRQLETASSIITSNSIGAYYFANTIGSFHYWVYMFFTLFSFVVLSLVVYTVMVLQMDGEESIEVRDVWENIKQHLIPALYSCVGLALLCMLGFLFLILPGVYLLTVFSLFLIVLVREEAGFVDAMERCFYLIKGNWWPSFGFLLIMAVIQGVFSFIASLPAVVVYILRIFHLPGGDNDMVLLVVTAFSTIAGLLLYMVVVTGIAFQYFHLVEVKDGVGLLQQVKNIGRSSLQTASSQNEY